jgi:uncharacterized protein involved in exopolysaccharide biosynthesis
MSIQKQHSFTQIMATPHYRRIQSQRTSSNKINLLRLWSILLKGKRLVIGITLLLGVLGTLYALTTTPIYQTEALVAPTTIQKSNNRFSWLTNQYSGLANLTGITLPSHQSFNTAIATLKSRQFLQSFIQEHQLKPLLFPKQWDTQQQAWKKRYEKIKFIQTQPSTMEPRAEAAYKKLKAALSFKVDKKTGLITISMNWSNPELAAEWINKLVASINHTLRQQAITKAEKSIIYLRTQLQDTNFEELRTLYAQLIQEQIKNITLAKANDNYAFEILDPAVTPEYPIKPKRRIIVLSSLLIGFILGSIWVLMTDAMRKKRQKK